MKKRLFIALLCAMSSCDHPHMYRLAKDLESELLKRDSAILACSNRIEELADSIEDEALRDSIMDYATTIQHLIEDDAEVWPRVESVRDYFLY